MPIVMREGETLESRHGVSSKYGGGTFHVTNQALIVEIDRRGIVFHRFHNQVANMIANGRKKIKITWPEKLQIKEFEFKVKGGAAKLVQEIKAAHPYSLNYAREGISHVALTKAEKIKIKDDRRKWAQKNYDAAVKQLRKHPDDKETKIDVNMWRLYLERDLDDATVNRSLHVPEDVPDHMVWNDCWIDQTGSGGLDWGGKYMYTLNQYWVSKVSQYAPIKGSKTHDETGAYGIPMQYVKWYCGYPYVRGDAFERPIYKTGVIIPTMIDEMRKSRLEASRFLTDSGEWEPDSASRLAYIIGGPLWLLTKSELYKKMTPLDLEWLCTRGFGDGDELERLGLKCRPETDQELIAERLAADLKEIKENLPTWCENPLKPDL